jgi:hypothetical protein
MAAHLIAREIPMSSSDAWGADVGAGDLAGPSAGLEGRDLELLELVGGLSSEEFFTM